MAELNKNYKCSICGNLVKVLQAGIGELVCCGQPMNIVAEEVGTEQKPMGEESPTTAEPTLPEQSMPPIPETPTEKPSQEEPQV